MEQALHYPQHLLLGAIGLQDALPDSIRAMLAALLLVVFLRFFEARIPGHEFHYGQSFRKAALVALIAIPLLVWLFPASRMVVFVEDLMPARAGGSIWLVVLAVWAAGCMISAAVLIASYVTAHASNRRCTPTRNPKLVARLDHWAHRLGMTDSLQGPLELLEIPGGEPRFLASGKRIAIPTAALHWPGNLQDVLLILSLSHLKRRHGHWHLFGQIVNCAYWPLPWTQSLHANLLRDFRRSADELAESCYQDRLGYARTLRQLEQRLAAPASGRGAPGESPLERGYLQALWSPLTTYASRIGRLLSPSTEVQWRFEELLAVRSTDAERLWTDPYDRVVLFVGQAVFLAFLLTGVTLRERPPEPDYEYSMPFELLWKEHFHRNQELLEKVTPSSS